MATCLCDTFYDEAARAAVEVLEFLECEVIFPENQTCCGQPAFNGGDWKASRAVVRLCAEVFAGDMPIIVPSGSCAAMFLHGVGLEFENEPDREAMSNLTGRTWELFDYIVNGLGIESWPGTYPKRVAFHHSCHTRGTDSGPAAVKLLDSIDGLTIVPFGEGEQCCGFGGTFSVSFPNISERMGDLKIDHVLGARPDVLASGDMGCLMHLSGLAQRKERPIPMVHAVQVLKDSVVGEKLGLPKKEQEASS